MKIYQGIATCYSRDRSVYITNLARLANVLIVLNISLFFLTELVTLQGYYYTFYSLALLGLVYAGILIPHRWADRLWYYFFLLTLVSVAVYFVVISGWHWIATSRPPM